MRLPDAGHTVLAEGTSARLGRSRVSYLQLPARGCREGRAGRTHRYHLPETQMPLPEFRMVFWLLLEICLPQHLDTPVSFIYGHLGQSRRTRRWREHCLFVTLVIRSITHPNGYKNSEAPHSALCARP